MSSTAIRVEQLSKRYRIGRTQRRHDTLRDALAQGVRHWLRRNGHGESDTFWALKDVSFEVKRGEVLGIIGRNGAGKSTLLKILSRITEPTSGYAEIHGRVGSLLEVGTGFHPELTGRENIYLNGAILGMKRAEIARKFDEIVAFAEVEQFLDTPVKHFSSGMYVRLAFAVAAHLDPEILIVDEVLAVGDAAFQKKCLTMMSEVATEGRTVIFVSHNLQAILSLCGRGLYLHGGLVRLDGQIEPVLARYELDTELRGDLSDSGSRRGLTIPQGDVRFVDWHAEDSGAQVRHACFSRDTCRFVFTLVSHTAVKEAEFGFVLRDQTNQLILTASSLDNNGRRINIGIGTFEVVFQIRVPLKAGNYPMEIALHGSGVTKLDFWRVEPPLTVMPRTNQALPPVWQGLVNEDSRFEFNETAPAH